MRVSGLFLYPVKSLRGFAVPSAEVDALGLAGDRRFLVVDADGRFLTQRALPRMALVSTALSPGLLRLSAEGCGSATVSTAHDPAARLSPVSVWGHQGMMAEDCGDDTASWLSQALETSCRLLRAGPAFHRPVTKETARPGDVFSFADGAPFLLTHTATFEELNRRIIHNGGSPVPMDRFRPNVVVEGGAPFAEDGWSQLHLGPLAFRSAGRCARCLMVTADQTTGQRGKEPLKTLATFPRDPKDPSSVFFGINLIHESKTGIIRIGDPVTAA